MTPAAERAAAMHEQFMLYVDAGFNQEQALRLVMNDVNNATPEPEDDHA